MLLHYLLKDHYSLRHVLPLAVINPGGKLPPIKAEIAYNGAGRLIGRGEVVMPGDEAPSEQDLMTEASLPIEERGQQRRYAQRIQRSRRPL